MRYRHRRREYWDYDYPYWDDYYYWRRRWDYPYWDDYYYRPWWRY